MVGLVDRVAWAIDTIKWDEHLARGIQDVELAKILGTNKDTLAAYRKRKGLLKGAVIERLVSHYDFSPEWLFKGMGEPFPGARKRYPDVCGPEESLGVIIRRHRENMQMSVDELAKLIGVPSSYVLKWENGTDYPDMRNDSLIARTMGIDINIIKRLRFGETMNKITSEPQDQYSDAPPPDKGQEFRISDALSMCASVLESGTSYATALYLNIQHFDRAVKAESQISLVIQQNKQQENKIAALETENARMQIQLTNLQSAVEKLQERNGKPSESKGENNDTVAKDAAM